MSLIAHCYKKAKLGWVEGGGISQTLRQVKAQLELCFRFLRCHVNSFYFSRPNISVTQPPRQPRPITWETTSSSHREWMLTPLGRTAALPAQFQQLHPRLFSMSTFHPLQSNRIFPYCWGLQKTSFDYKHPFRFCGNRLSCIHNSPESAEVLR